MFATDLGHDSIACSSGWLARFKAGYNLTTTVVSGKGAAADKDGAEDWASGKLQHTLCGYSPEDVFNIVGSALFFEMLPDRTPTFKGEMCTKGKQAKERLTIAFAVNIPGTEKLPLLVIGKAVKPRRFKGCPRLPTGMLYRNNTKAWMILKLFEEYVQLLDRRFTVSGRKVVMVVDNTSSRGN